MSTFQVARRPAANSVSHKLRRPYQVYCNAFPILRYPSCKIYHYDSEFSVSRFHPPSLLIASSVGQRYHPFYVLVCVISHKDISDIP